MKLTNRIPLLITLGALVVLLACAGQVTPVPANTPVPVQQTATPAISKAIPHEETAWNTILESARKEGKLTIYSYNFVGDTGLSVSRAFKGKYGISVDIITGRGAEFLERVKTEKRMGQLAADMTEGNAGHLRAMKDEGLTIGVASELPALREEGKWVADIFGIDPRDRHLIAFNFTVYTPFVNTKIVKPGEEPKVYNDLLDPKWKGKMILTDPNTSAGPYQFLVPLMREKVIDENFIKSLFTQDMRFSSALPDEAGILARGERALSIRGVDSAYSRFIAEGAPIQAIALSDGTVLSVIVATAYNGAPHPNAAKVFINWLMSPEGQTIWGKASSVSSARNDVPNFLPKPAQITAQRPILLTNEYSEEATRLFRERWLMKLWGR